MHSLTFRFYLLLLIAPSLASSQVETILAVDTDETVDTQTLNILKDQLQDRLDRSAFLPATVAISEAAGQLVVTANVDTQDEKAMAAYRRLFASTTLRLWNTYRIDDEEIVQWVRDISPVEGFDFNAAVVGTMKLLDQEVELLSNGGRDVHMAALGVCFNEADKQRILDHLTLQAQRLPELKLLWSPRTVDRYTKEAYYVLFMIKTDGREIAPLTEAHIASIQAYQIAYTNDEFIRIQFNATGTAIWADMTKTAAQNRRSIAIVINGLAYSAPAVMGEIPTGEMVIARDFTPEEASELAQKLELGRLAYPLQVVSTTNYRERR
jgi:hypothetical protein